MGFWDGMGKGEVGRAVKRFAAVGIPMEFQGDDLEFPHAPPGENAPLHPRHANGCVPQVGQARTSGTSRMPKRVCTASASRSARAWTSAAVAVEGSVTRMLACLGKT